MCDYSLHGIKNRLAKEGETLMVHRFYTGSKGLTSPEYLRSADKPQGWLETLKRMFSGPSNECAVCIPDGARVVLTGISPALQQAHGLCATESVVFRQLSAEAATYRDAVEFRNGMRLRIQELQEGQPVQIVALSSEEAHVPERDTFPTQARLGSRA
jgi:hypothetical protein